MNEESQNVHTPENNNQDGTVLIKINHPSTSFSSMEFNCLIDNNNSKNGQRSKTRRKMNDESSTCTFDKIPRIILKDCMKSSEQQLGEVIQDREKEPVDVKINITCNVCQLTFLSLKNFLDHLKVIVEMEMKENIQPQQPKISKSSSKKQRSSKGGRNSKGRSKKSTKAKTTPTTNNSLPMSISDDNINLNVNSIEHQTENETVNSFLRERLLNDYNNSDKSPTTTSLETEIDIKEEVPDDTNEMEVGNEIEIESEREANEEEDLSRTVSPNKNNNDNSNKLDDSVKKGKTIKKKKKKLIKDFCCDKCGQICSTFSSFSSHQSAHLPRTFSCTVENCEWKFSTAHRLKAHMLTHPQFRPSKCLLCPRSFRSEWALKVHVKIHEDPEGRPFRCSFESCTAAFSAPESLHEHKKKRHPPSGVVEKQFICTWSGCSSSFLTAFNLKKHVRVHTGERPYKCDHFGCGATFQTATHLKQHGSVHSTDLNQLCGVCGKGFKTIASLRQHEARVHGQTFDSNPTRVSLSTNFPCNNPGCGRSFTTLSRLTNHQNLHKKDYYDNMQLEQNLE